MTKDEHPSKQEILKAISDAVYAQYPKKEWQGNKEFVGLSNDEIAKIIGKGAFYEWNDVEFARAIEQALKDKNT